ncbi:GDH/6PGL endoplasmic bifunctional protein-like [Antedon mediterranea]|uniref:GDH/6PGL endoplasmic bifunctional protein-like n=1 Tax=Antedon mediterranea TaxID=105859 RepID=UPI003AF571B4
MMTSLKASCVWLSMALIIGAIAIVSTQHPVPTTKITSVVIVGATGDLAQRYLWQGFFNLFVEMESVDHHLKLYGATRVNAEEGTVLLKNILNERVQCNKLTVPIPSNCEDLREKFLSRVQYKQLKKAEQYQELCKMFEMEADQEHAKENGRWFYLSVPAFAYANIAENVGSFCRPTVSNTWLRVVLEKPFGHDLMSAKKLSDQLMEHLHDEEMYRIDHYLGKTGVSSILLFRQLNQDKYEQIWNKHHVERVEIVMKEKLDVTGRFSFYNEYGVIRDVMQNHLTEILALIAMEIPADISSPEQHRFEKINLMNKIQPIRKQHAVIGQYKAYQEELRDELGKADNFTSLVPTFAGVTLFINSPRWFGVPFVLVSGKKMDSKSGYARIVFKQNNFCVNDGGIEGDCGTKQIVIYTGGTGETKPMLLVSKNLLRPNVFADWTTKYSFEDQNLFGSDFKDFNHYSPPVEADAYSALLRSCFLGEKQNFIASDDLMQSWKIWSPLLKDLEGTIPREYPGGINNGEILDFVSLTSGTQFVTQQNEPLFENRYQHNIAFKTSTFRNEFLVSGEAKQVIEALAVDIYNSSIFSIKSRGYFHLALSGGKSPVPLFHELSQLDSFPWRDTHIWLVDERCVDFDDDNSNFKSLTKNLIDYISIPYRNVHPMPITGVWENCDKEQSIYYDNDIRKRTNGIFDYIVLGLGKDGHTASLFPHSTALEEDRQFVSVTVNPSDGSSRLSLTYPCLNAARTVSVLVTGADKVDIVNRIKGGIVDKMNLPVTGVSPDSGVRWYIDDGALTG